MAEIESERRDGDRAGDIIYDRLRAAHDASVHLSRCSQTQDHYDKLAHWQRSVTCAVSALDNLPTVERSHAPKIKVWEVLRNQLCHVLNVDFQESMTTEQDGRELRSKVHTERRVYVRTKGAKGERVYVDPVDVYRLPTDSQIRDLKSVIGSIIKFLTEWEERIPDSARQFFMSLALLHLVGPESTGDATPIYWVCKDMKSRNRVFDIDASSVMLPDEAIIRRRPGNKIITALDTDKDLRFITAHQARRLSDQECVAALVIIDATGVDTTDIKSRFQTVNNDPGLEFLILELDRPEY